MSTMCRPPGLMMAAMLFGATVYRSVNAGAAFVVAVSSSSARSREWAIVKTNLCYTAAKPTISLSWSAVAPRYYSSTTQILAKKKNENDETTTATSSSKASSVIMGYHKDEFGDWVAELSCGHQQHVRHNPPMVERPWVLTQQGRDSFLGYPLVCKLCGDDNGSISIGGGTGGRRSAQG